MSIPKNYYNSVDCKKLGVYEISTLKASVDGVYDDIHDTTDGVLKRLTDLEGVQPVKIPFTLIAGTTVAEVRNSAITSESIFFIATDVYGLSPKSVIPPEEGENVFAMVFEAQLTDIHGYVMVW